jgi:hypothetical protein
MHYSKEGPHVSDAKWTALVIVAALALGYGVVFELKLHLTPPAVKPAKEPILLQSDGDAPATGK